MRADPLVLSLERRVARFVARHEVLRRGERALLMLSGGADSMAMLALVGAVGRHLDLGVGALHVDYGLRGADSDRDREIVVRACAAAGVPLDIVRLGAALHGPGFQARARAQRYRRAQEVAAAGGYDVILTAHNRDDQAETVLYRLTKYASPRSLVGMRPREPGAPGCAALARPLLCLGADEVRAYCRARGIEFGEDASNAELVYARNVVRHEVLPRLAGINPRVAETLAATAALAVAEREVLDAACGEAWVRAQAPVEADEVAALDLRALAREPQALRALVLRALVARARGPEALVARREVEALERLAARRDDAGAVALAGGWEVVRGGGRLRLRRRAPAHTCDPVVVVLPGVARWAADTSPGARRGAGVALSCSAVHFCGRAYTVRLVEGPLWPARTPPGSVGPGSRPGVGPEACVGLCAGPTRVVLRHPARGDRFAPLGVAGETTVARFLAAARVSCAARRRAVVLDVDGAVAWVGYESPAGDRRGRVAEARRVSDSTVYTLHVVEEAEEA